MSLSPQRKLLQVILAILLQASLLPGQVAIGCILQRAVGEDCCCSTIANPVHDQEEATAGDSCCGDTKVTPRSSTQHEDAIASFVTAESDSSCSCEVGPSDPLPAPAAVTDDSSPRAHALPAPTGTETSCYQDKEPRRYASGACEARSGPPIYLLNQIFLI